MSFRINTNLQAMSALRSLGMTTEDASRSMNRLSTGLRINSAADDPAGLIASESFRAQISGIQQAVRNNQDAVNYAKTAEGALDEVNRLLRDARALAVASANTGSLTDEQRVANQNQLTSIAASIDRIASQTAFGTKKLLNGSAGVTGNVTLATNFSAISFTGTFNNQAITTNSAVTVNVTTTAQRADLTGTQAFTNATDLVGAGSFSINGKTFTTSATDTVSSTLALINGATGQTGVFATWTTTQGFRLQTLGYGANARIDLTDSGAVLQSAVGSASDTGVNAIATVSVNPDGAGAVSVTFTGGRNGYDGLTISDAAGNSIRITEGGNVTGTVLAGQLVVGSAQFQIGSNSGETASLSLSNFSASQLGTTAVSGLNMGNLDLSTATGASDAIKVIDAAVSQVGRSRGYIGSFVRNTLESNTRSLQVQSENLSATESSIRDTDFAAEMTRFTKLQILQQSGMAMLAQANSAPQTILSLLR